MIFDWLKTFFVKLLKKLSFCFSVHSDQSGPETPEVIVRERKPTKKELALGWTLGIEEETDFPIKQLKGIPQEYRSTHFYVIGASGTGKTRFLEYLIQQDIENGFGFGVIDPHGDFVDDVKGWLYFAQRSLDRDLEKDVVLIEPINPEATVSFNPLEQIKGVPSEEIAGELEGIFKRIWWDAWGPRMADILRNSLIALIENNLTLVELPLFLTDDLIRKRVLKKVKNEYCLRCFKAYEKVNPITWREWIESTLNKVDALLIDHRIRHIFTLPQSSFNLRDIIDNQKIILVKLEKGKLKDGADLLGSLLFSKIHMTAFSRTDIPPEKRAPFYLYIDEFQNFATKSFIDVLSEARKYGLSLILAHQNLAQLPTELRASLLANCGIQTCFRVSREDAQIMAKELMTTLWRQPPGWEINVQTLQELEYRRCFIKNKIEGGVIAVETANMPSPWEVSSWAGGELDGITPETFKKSVEQARIGANYLIDRKKIEREYQRRYKELASVAEPTTFRESKKT